MRLSACMIAKNEEKNIARCIESYKDAVDEIIVVDTGSNDKTVEVAISMGATVYHYEWTNNFADAKNYAINHATGDWIIFLDADEYFVNNSAQNIVSLIQQLNSKYDVIACKMINIDSATGKKIEEFTQFRVFRRDKHIRYTNSVHEMLKKTAENNTLEVFLAKDRELLIYHTGYSRTNKLEKAERNLELLLAELDKDESNKSFYHYISDSYCALGDWENAIKYARLFIKSGISLMGYNTKPHENIIKAMIILKYNTEDILSEINNALEIFPDNPMFHFYLANVLMELKKYNHALLEYNLVLKLHNEYDDIEVNSIPLNLYYVHYYKGVIASHCNQHEEAFASFVESLKLENKQADCFRRLLMIIKDFPVEDIILLLNSVYKKDDKEDLHFIITTMMGVPLPQVLAYYSVLLIKEYGSDDLTAVYMLLANSQFDKTFAIAQKCLHEDPSNNTFAAIAVVSALMSEREEYLDWVEEHTSEPMKSFVKGMVRHELVVFDQKYTEEYLNLINYMYLFGTKEILDRGVRLAQYFEEKIVYAELGNFFFQHENYLVALKLYQQYRKQLVIENKQLVNQIYAEGICWYKLREYNNAAASLIKAYDLGYRKNDIYEFLRWSMDNLPRGNDLEQKYLEINEHGLKTQTGSKT